MEKRGKAASSLAGFERFFAGDPTDWLSRGSGPDAGLWAVELFHRVARTVPAYAAFLREHGVDVAGVRSLDDFAGLPPTSKELYYRRYSLPDLCREGRLSDCDMLAVSSGSSGEPAIWPRFVTDELQTAVRFEQVLIDAFEVGSKRTLGVVCFALGSWVGGMYTTACCRYLAAKGYPLTLVTPGNQKVEILRVLKSLAPCFEQIVLFGYPPFLKDVIDTGQAEGFEWARHRVRLVLAGEVFSEAWRDWICERLGKPDPAHATASLYGTADGGVLANETPLSIRIRRALAEAPGVARELFGEARLPTLCQYDPGHRFFEVEPDGSLLFTADGGIPLIRYKILDRGGLVSYPRMIEFLRENGIRLQPTKPARNLPFVFLFGRSSFALSYYGANVYPENVAAGIERPEFSDQLTGKFVMEIAHDADQNPSLSIAVELRAGLRTDEALASLVAQSIRAAILRQNSEFSNYAPASRQMPRVTLYHQGQAEYFPIGSKHRYTRH